MGHKAASLSTSWHSDEDGLGSAQSSSWAQEEPFQAPGQYNTFLKGILASEWKRRGTLYLPFMPSDVHKGPKPLMSERKHKAPVASSDSPSDCPVQAECLL